MNTALAATYATDSRLFDMDSFTLKHLEHALVTRKPPEMLIVPIRIAIAPRMVVGELSGRRSGACHHNDDAANRIGDQWCRAGFTFQ